MQTEPVTVMEFMNDQVVTATPVMTLKQVDELLVTNQISGMPVVHDDKLVGVISQSDIIRRLFDEQIEAQRVADFHQSPFPIPIPSLEALAQDSRRISDHMIHLTAAEVMSPVPVTVPAEAGVGDVARIMVDERIHRVLVTDGDELIGVVSALDLIRVLADE